MLDILPFGVNVRGAYSSWGSYAELIAWASGHVFFCRSCDCLQNTLSVGGPVVLKIVPFVCFDGQHLSITHLPTVSKCSGFTNCAVHWIAEELCWSAALF